MNPVLLPVTTVRLSRPQCVSCTLSRPLCHGRVRTCAVHRRGERLCNGLRARARHLHSSAAGRARRLRFARSRPRPAVISDYVPRGIQAPVRVGVVGLSALTALGLAKLALAGAKEDGDGRRGGLLAGLVCCTDACLHGARGAAAWRPAWGSQAQPERRTVTRYGLLAASRPRFSNLHGTLLATLAGSLLRCRGSSEQALLPAWLQLHGRAVGRKPTRHCARLTARVPARLRAAPLALIVHMRCLNAALPAGLGGPLPLVGCPAGPGIGGAVKELWKSKKE